MADKENRSGDRTAVTASAEALSRAREEVANITFEDDTRRERLISLLNTVGEGLGSIGDSIAEIEDEDGVDASGKVNPNRQGVRTSDGKIRH